MQDQGALTSVWGLLMSLWPEAEMRIQGHRRHLAEKSWLLQGWEQNRDSRVHSSSGRSALTPRQSRTSNQHTTKVTRQE